MQDDFLSFSPLATLRSYWSALMFPLNTAGLITILVLACATFVLLLAMLLTICLSNQVQRDAAFLNFFIVTIMISWYLVYSRMAMLSPIKLPNPALDIQQPSVVLMGSVSLCSLLLHVAVVMQNVFRPMSTKHRKRIEAALIIAPYLSAPIPLLELFITSIKFTVAINYFIGATSIIATIIDVVLLVVFNKYRLKLSQIEGFDGPVIPNSLLIRMSFLCVYRLLITLAGLSTSTAEVDLGTSLFFRRMAIAYAILLPLYPTIIALVFLQKDILSVWISFFSPRKIQSTHSSA